MDREITEPVQVPKHVLPTRPKGGGRGMSLLQIRQSVSGAEPIGGQIEHLSLKPLLGVGVEACSVTFFSSIGRTFFKVSLAIPRKEGRFQPDGVFRSVAMEHVTEQPQIHQRPAPRGAGFVAPALAERQ